MISVRLGDKGELFPKEDVNFLLSQRGKSERAKEKEKERKRKKEKERKEKKEKRLGLPFFLFLVGKICYCNLPRI